MFPVLVEGFFRKGFPKVKVEYLVQLPGKIVILNHCIEYNAPTIRGPLSMVQLRQHLGFFAEGFSEVKMNYLDAELLAKPLLGSQGPCSARNVVPAFQHFIQLCKCL